MEDAIETARAYLEGKYLDRFDPERCEFEPYLWTTLKWEVVNAVFALAKPGPEGPIPPDEAGEVAEPERTEEPVEAVDSGRMKLEAFLCFVAAGMNRSSDEARVVFNSIVSRNEFKACDRFWWRAWLTELLSMTEAVREYMTPKRMTNRLLMPPSWFQASRKPVDAVGYLATRLAAEHSIPSEGSISMLGRIQAGQESAYDRLLLRLTLASLDPGS